MSSDSFYSIGSTHIRCDDYAYATTDRAIVSDGCSQFSHLDVSTGARILCHTDTIDQAVNVSKQMNLPAQSLFATVVKVYRQGDCVQFEMYGDGAIMYFGPDEYWAEILNADNSMPYYPIYAFNIMDYEHSYQTIKIKNGAVTTGLATGNSYMLTVEAKPGFYLVATDGISHFNVPPQQIVEDLRLIKNPYGRFLERTMLFLHKKWKKENVFHEDDFAVAGIHIA